MPETILSKNRKQMPSHDTPMASSCDGISGFRSVLGEDPDFPAEAGRYHLFVALNCPWCHRVTLARNVLGLQDSITMDVAFPSRTGDDDPIAPNL